MNLTLENISRVLDYRTGETIEEWLARTGLTPNHMRAALNELKLFVREPLRYEPDGSGRVPTHEELTAAWMESTTTSATPWWEKTAPAPVQRPDGEIPWWEKPAPAPRQRPEGEVPWWEKGRAAAAQRREVLDDGPRWWESSRARIAARGRRLTPAEIERALEEIYRRADLTAWGTWRDYCERHRITREEVIRIFRLDEPDCRYLFEAERSLPGHDRLMSENWPAGCRRPGVARDEMIASIRSVVDDMQSCRTIEPDRGSRAADRGYDRER